MYFIFAWLQVLHCTTYCFVFPHLPKLMKSGELSYLWDCELVWHFCEKILLTGWSFYFRKWSLWDLYHQNHFMDWLAKCVCEYAYLVNNSNSLLMLPYLPLLPSAWSRKYMYILAEELLGLDNVVVVDSVEMCLWILYAYVVHSLYINVIFAATVCKWKLPDSIVGGTISQSKVEAWNQVSVDCWSSIWPSDRDEVLFVCFVNALQ